MELAVLIGGNVSGRLSSAVHTAAFKQLGLNLRHESRSVAKENLGHEAKRLEKEALYYNVTDPLKEQIMEFVNPDDIAKKIGAVNLVVGNKGYNTDHSGFARSLEDEIKDVRDLKFVLVGAGGFARAIAYALKSRKADVLIVNRTYKKAKELAKSFSCDYKKIEFLNEDSMDVLINATPSDLPIKPIRMRGYRFYFDARYHHNRTLAKASKCGVKPVDGLKMLVYQAADSIKIATGLDPDVNLMLEAARKARQA